MSVASQTIDHQRSQADAAGFKINEVIADDGISGVTTKLADRPQGRRLFDMLREGDVLVVRWVDRLGRNYEDVTDTIRTMMKKGVIVRTVINNMTFDGSIKDPTQKAVRDALIAFMSATAQAQAEATREAQRAGIQHAMSKGDRYLGRKPSYSRDQFNAVREMLSQDNGISLISKSTGLSRQAIYRIRDNPVEAEASLAAWGL